AVFFAQRLYLIAFARLGRRDETAPAILDQARKDQGAGPGRLTGTDLAKNGQAFIKIAAADRIELTDAEKLTVVRPVAVGARRRRHRRRRNLNGPGGRQHGSQYGREQTHEDEAYRSMQTACSRRALSAICSHTNGWTQIV